MTFVVHTGDCREVLPLIAADSIDACVTDPPYGLGFMGKDWDHGVPGVHFWQEVLRVLKPGAHLVAFGGTRTYHRLAVAIEDAGFEVRDCLGWLYGSGFPKSLDVSKAIDKMNGRDDLRREFGAWLRVQRERAGLTAAEVNRQMGTPQGCGWWEGKGAGAKWDLHLPGRETYARLKALLSLPSDWDEYIEWAEAEREKVGEKEQGRLAVAPGAGANRSAVILDITAPATDSAKQWQGWGTALKPAWEPIILARKPLVGTVAANVQEHGTGALNIDGCRVETTDGYQDNAVTQGVNGARTSYAPAGAPRTFEPQPGGRWPANICHDGSEEVLAVFPDVKAGVAVRHNSGGKNCHSDTIKPVMDDLGYDDSGSAARFFYCAKASREDRNEGLSGFGPRVVNTDTPPGTAGASPRGSSAGRSGATENHHPTVKPTDLMRWLCRLITPPGGTVLDPFMGSGSTGKAADIEGFDFIGIELDPEYAEIARARIVGTAPLFAQGIA